MRIIYSGICDIGLKRQENQDSVYMYSEKNKDVSLFVVADGMGGHAEGRAASNIITMRLKEWIGRFSIENYEGRFSKMMQALENKIEEISREIFHTYNQTQICGSTCILLFIYKEQYGILNVGDSRIYKRTGWNIKSLMKDDVWENKIEVNERFSKKQIENHMNYGKLLQAVGIKENISIASKTDSLKPRDTFLLCSDGLYKYCKEKDIAKILRNVSENNIMDSAKKLMEKCYEVGAKDNISIIIVKCI